MKIYGLLGRNIEYSFSRSYFAEKFSAENIPASYRNFDIQDISRFPEVLRSTPELSGLNVTIPYKETVIPFLDQLDEDAGEIGAVNTIKFEKDGSLTGYNTDHFGFSESIKQHLRPEHTHALILGTGGASKAVAYALKQLGLETKFVSRRRSGDNFTYIDLDAEVLKKYKVIINCTPLGTSPNIEQHPDIPFQHLGKDHLIYDLIYNPAKTTLMKKAAQKGATCLNGLEMLRLQAEKSWEIWNR